jgi:hypothetical protein
MTEFRFRPIFPLTARSKELSLKCFAFLWMHVAILRFQPRCPLFLKLHSQGSVFGDDDRQGDIAAV